jgi:hypothetical protein
LAINPVDSKLTPVAGSNTDFEDTDFGSGQASDAAPAPTLSELDGRLTGAHSELARLKQSSDELERQIQSIEERRRRRTEFARGLEEMRQHLTRANGLLGKAELDARREAEQLARTLETLRAAEISLEPLDESQWTAENWESELTKGLTAVEAARMDFNAARLKWPVLDGESGPASPGPAPSASLAELPMRSLLRLGLALTWPLAAVALVGFAVVALLALRR